MKHLPHVTKADYESGYTIRTTFDDGTTKLIDFAPWLKGPVFAALKSKKFFKSFFLDGGTVAWPNGADIAPETLYAADSVDTRDNHRVERSAKRGRSR